MRRKKEESLCLYKMDIFVDFSFFAEIKDTIIVAERHMYKGPSVFQILSKSKEVSLRIKMEVDFTFYSKTRFSGNRYSNNIRKKTVRHKDTLLLFIAAH